MMQEDDISDLLQRYEQMLISGKNIYFDADEYDLLAEYYEKFDEIDTAKDLINKGLKIHPNNELLMLRYAGFLVYDANYTGALRYLADNFSDDNTEQNLLKIECFLQLGLYAEAHQLTVTILEDEDISTGEILSELGFLYLDSDYFEESILYLEKSLEYIPDDAETLYDLVYAYEALENFKSAIAVCEKILDIDPYALDAWLMVGKLYSLENDYEKAIDAFDFALTMDDSNINVLKLKAHCLILSNRLNEATEILKQSIEIGDEDIKTHLALIDCYIDMELYDELKTTLDKAEVLFGEIEELMVRKAYSYLFENKPDEAEALIEKTINKNLDSESLNIIVGDFYLKVNNYQKAEIFYLKSIKLSEENGDESTDESILDKLVNLYIKSENISEAITYQKKILETTQSPLHLKKLTLLYLEIGDKDNYKSITSSFSDEMLLSFYKIFYPEDTIEPSTLSRDYLFNRLDDIYESRLLYKNIKY